MSSIDSAINSLSAATMEDFVRPRLQLTDGRVLRWVARLYLFWGWRVLCFLFSRAYRTDHIRGSHQVGSMSGPLLALFTTALLLRSVPQRFALSGLFLVCLLIWA